LAICQKTPVNILKNIFEKNLSPHGEISPPPLPPPTQERGKKKKKKNVVQVPQNPLVYGSDWKMEEDDATKAKERPKTDGHKDTDLVGCLLAWWITGSSFPVVLWSPVLRSQTGHVARCAFQGSVFPEQCAARH
jgi:hypothetical protein